MPCVRRVSAVQDSELSVAPSARTWPRALAVLMPSAAGVIHFPSPMMAMPSECSVNSLLELLR